VQIGLETIFLGVLVAIGVCAVLLAAYMLGREDVSHRAPPAARDHDDDP